MAREITKAQRQAVAKYESKAYDKTLIRLPKGTLDSVRAAAELAGASLNGWIGQAIEHELHGGRGSGVASGYVMPPETEKAAREAAKANGEEFGAWLRRTIQEQAKRDEFGRMLKR